MFIVLHWKQQESTKMNTVKTIKTSDSATSVCYVLIPTFLSFPLSSKNIG